MRLDTLDAQLAPSEEVRSPSLGIKFVLPSYYYGFVTVTLLLLRIFKCGRDFLYVAIAENGGLLYHHKILFASGAGWLSILADHHIALDHEPFHNHSVEATSDAL
jgi:hypothetical protein